MYERHPHARQHANGKTCEIMVTDDVNLVTRFRIYAELPFINSKIFPEI